MFEKQKQETGDGGTAYQAGKNITVNKIGLQFSEVKEIFHLLLNENFPKLREIASQTANQNIENFLDKFEKKFAENFNRIDFKKIADPDVQFSFNEVVEANARRGDKVDADVLSELLIERIGVKSNNFISIVSSEAVKIVPKLTAEHISFLSLVHYLSSITQTTITNFRQLEQASSSIIGLTSNGFNLSLSNLQYLQFTGVLTHIRIMGDDFIATTKNRYNFLETIPDDKLKILIKKRAPSYQKLIEVYESDELYQITLTSVGQMIALANLKRVLGNLDYEIWIK